MDNFIPEDKIFQELEDAKSKPAHAILEVILKAGAGKGLSPSETAILINSGIEFDERIFTAARSVKQRIYGNRIVLFAPLYITNECGNDCAYCGFRSANRDLKRKTLTEQEISEEVRILEEMGHKRLLLVYGEHPAHDAGWIAETMAAVYRTKTGKSGEIRRANVNCAPLEVEGYKKLKAAEIGTYQCFQETYHLETYARMHLGGKKKDYLYRLYALDRAQQAGIDDLATGVLFGLYDWKFELMALLYHALHMEAEFGVGPHTISVPRLEPALGSDVSFHPPYAVSDHDFKRIVAILRLAVPYTGLILTTRENPELRRSMFDLGTSQISAGSKTYPGGYHDMISNMPDKQQFTVGDERPLSEVVHDLVTHGYLPSFCTACYRLGRTGEKFMGITKNGHIHEFCTRNALLTFKEYLLDYAPESLRAAGNLFLESELQKTPEKISAQLKLRLRAMELKGVRDQYF
ncbi:MAG: [FeFe] hydrogenase H-cluster radical SAM maturase HydG [Candidatus Wallbacteria bacterium]|nr:[FeFe] hydrogenase H-cluster radical SAM maturase HydG [Candidatus Wallbacteria bacterium]